MGNNTRDQRGSDIHKIVSNGVTVEWTDRRSEADAAFREATKAEWWMVTPEGMATLIKKK